jgi:nucleophosmin 1
MEFWGIEVKAGEPAKVNPGGGRLLHLSQATLGPAKKDKVKETVFMNIDVEGKNLVLGSLHSEKCPQQMFDLVFNVEFELSHNWKNGSVYFFGYTAPEEEGDDDSEFESEDDNPVRVANNGKQVKPAAGENSNGVKDSGAGKKVTIVEPKKDVKAEEDEDSSDDSDAMMSVDDSDSDSEEEGAEGSSDDEDDSDEDEETPKKVEPSKKRPSESASKTPVPSKKAKVSTPQKTDGKKGTAVHVATPHPAKKGGKTSGGASTSNEKAPKSEGSHSCKTCNRSFKSEIAFESHNKAKHSGGK